VEIGHYQVQGELSRGGMGVVYRAYDTRLGRPVALKVLLSSPRDRRLRARFEQEVQVLARLSHPHIVQVHDSGVYQGTPYMVLELVEGQTLGDRIAEGEVSVREAVEIASKLARALECVHEAEALHRDLKPHNVLLDLRGEPRLTDFGIAKNLDADARRLSRSGAVMGSPGYLPPEQALGVNVGPGVDIYGLGATLYATLTGEPPIVGQSMVEVMAATVGVQVAPPSKIRAEVDRELDAIVLRCLEKEPSQRYASAAELGDALEVWLARPARKSQGGLWALVGAVLGASLVGGTLFFARGRAAAAGPSPANTAEPTASKAHASPAPTSDEAAAEATPENAGQLLKEPMRPATLALLKRAGDALRAERDDDALAIYSRCVEEDPDDPEAYKGRAAVFMRQENYDAAVLELNLALARVKGHSGLLNLRGLSHLRSRRPHAALEDFDASLARSPEVAQVHLNRGLANEALGNFAEARDDMTRAIEQEPKLAWAHHNRGLYRFNLGDAKGAVADFSEALRLDPRIRRAHLHRGQANAASHDLRAAVRDFSRVLEVYPADHPNARSARMMRARALEMLGAGR
jgi:tetratricopeptide (TPR) repeat protein